MGDITCCIDGCARSPRTKRMCNMHYLRSRRTGDPLVKHRNLRSAADRFWTKVDPGDCWVWVGHLNSTGYGKFRDGKGAAVLAHRWAYQELVGLIPLGLQLDHLCRNRACVNPDHLEPVTPYVNNMRGATFGARNAAKTACIRGHAFDAANTRIVHATGSRACRACERANDRNRKRTRGHQGVRRVG